MANIPDCPLSLKNIQHYLKTAAEHDARDPVVAYWARLHALQSGLKITTKKTPDETKLLMAIMEWLEEAKRVHKDNEAISNEVAAQAHLENYALKLFLTADKLDRNQNYGKNIVKLFYTSAMIYDILTAFGDLTDEAIQNRKYAKWKAAYIHNCLKNGQTPVPGPMQPEDGSEDSEGATGSDSAPHTSPDVPGFSLPTNPSTPPVDPFSQPSNAASPPVVPSSFNNSLPDPTTVMRAASQMPPVPYTPDPNPGGFVPYDPSQQSIPQTNPLYGDASANMVATLTPDQIAKAQKYCKWAGSALNYDDVKTAISNLKNALELLQTGRDPA